MKQDSLLRRNELFIATATVAAHAVGHESGFRQRDLKFIAELFANWADLKPMQEAIEIKNVQVKRYVEYLVSEGFARQVARKDSPLYRLTRTGLLELMSRIAQRRCFVEREHFFFLYYFLKNYKPHIEELARSEGKLFPFSLKIELEALLDIKALIEAELGRAEKELKRADYRIETNYDCAKFVKKSEASGMPYSEIVAEVERLFPYELNSQKPLSELIRQIPPVFQHWELEEGGAIRARQIWEPSRSVLKKYIEEIRKLLREYD